MTRASEGESTDAPARPTATYRRRKDFRQPEILNAARNLIEEEGASNVTVARIARAAGVSEATVYKYFDNKQDLVSQVLVEWATPFIERLDAELAPITELRSRLILIAMRFLRSMEETPRLHRVFFQEIRWSEPRWTSFHDLNRNFAKTVIDTVRDGARIGEICADIDPRMFRDMLFGGLEHIAMRTSFSGNPIDIETAAAHYVDMMLRGAQPRVPDVKGEDELRRFSVLIDQMEHKLRSA